MFKCDECDDWTTKYKHCLTRHIENVHSKLFKCRFCRAKFKSKDDQLLHEKTKHQPLHCNICDHTTRFEKKLKKHYEIKHRPSQKRKRETDEEISQKKINNNSSSSPFPPIPPPAPPPIPPLPPPAPPPIPPLPPPIPPKPSSSKHPPVNPKGYFKNILSKTSFSPNQNWDLLKTQAFYKKILNIELKRKLSKFRQLKFHIVFDIKLFKYKDDELEYAYRHFNSGTQVVLHEGDVEEKIDFSMQEIVRRFEEFLKLGSGWVYEETSKIDLSVFKYRPQRGGKYIRLEPWIKKNWL